MLWLNEQTVRIGSKRDERTNLNVDNQGLEVRKCSLRVAMGTPISTIKRVLEKHLTSQKLAITTDHSSTEFRDQSLLLFMAPIPVAEWELTSSMRSNRFEFGEMMIACTRPVGQRLKREKMEN